MMDTARYQKMHADKRIKNSTQDDFVLQEVRCNDN